MYLIKTTADSHIQEFLCHNHKERGERGEEVFEVSFYSPKHFFFWIDFEFWLKKKTKTQPSTSV